MHDRPVFLVDHLGDRLYSAIGNKLCVWDIREGKQTNAFAMPFPIELICYVQAADQCLITGANRVALVDLTNGNVLAEHQGLDQPIVQWQSASDSNRVVARCGDGHLLILDDRLTKVQQLPKIVSQGDVAISPAGDQVFFWQEGQPQQLSLTGLESGDVQSLPPDTLATQSFLTLCGKRQVFFIGDHTVSRMSYEDRQLPMSDRFLRRQFLLWRPLQAWTIPDPGNTEIIQIYAERFIDGKPEKVFFTYQLPIDHPNIAEMIPATCQALQPSPNGRTLVEVMPDEVLVFDRALLRMGDFSYMNDRANNIFIAKDFSILDALRNI